MSEKKPSNPYAFPLSVSTPVSVEYTTGMTLRDYFAAKAMQGITANPGTAGVGAGMIDEAARISYELADAMLRAREAKQ